MAQHTISTQPVTTISRTAARGAWLVSAGLVGFVGLAVFFEVVVGLSGHRSGRLAGMSRRPC